MFTINGLVKWLNVFFIHRTCGISPVSAGESWVHVINELKGKFLRKHQGNWLKFCPQKLGFHPNGI